jgi:hypothetical protein
MAIGAPFEEIIGNRVRIPDGRAAVSGETFQIPLD